MSYKRLAIVMCVTLGCFLNVGIGLGNDLDDGISTYKEDSISSYDNLGNPEKNVNFLKMDAKSRAKVRARGQGSESACGTEDQAGSGNMNSVVMGAGGTVKGDIYIIDESKGDKTIVVDD